MKSSSWVVIDSLDNKRGQFDSYYSSLQSVVPTPETRFVDINSSQSWDVVEIQNAMRNMNIDRAFVRTMQKSAPDNIHAGSIIQDTTTEEINRTVSALLSQIQASPWSHGNKLAIRELLDLNFCMGDKHTLCHPEIRYFIEGGEILYSIPDTAHVNCAQKYEYLTDTITDASPPNKLARKVATEFTDLPWAADFVMDTNGDWYCIELNLNGVRWDNTHNRWINMCDHGSKECYSPAFMHGSLLE